MHSEFSMSMIWEIFFGITISVLIPFYTFFILKKKFNIDNSGAIAAAYGSVSAVTFVTAISFLEMQNHTFSGHMVAVMALMEASAIIVGVILIRMYSKNNTTSSKLSKVLKHSFTNGSVLLIIGSLIIGLLASDKAALGIKPFTTDIFKGFFSYFSFGYGDC